MHRIGSAILTVLLMLPFARADELPREILAFERPSQDTHLVGEERFVTARHEDTLVSVGAAHALGYRELVLANPGVDPWLPGEGELINLPTSFLLPSATREGIVVNVAELRLYYYPSAEPGRVLTFPVSVGRTEWRTPVVTTRVISKTHNPTWYPPDSIRTEYAESGRFLPRIVPPGPDNPLGEYALNLEIPGIFIHGTNRPSGIGMRVTHGCIRLHPRDMELLVGQVVSRETPVTFVDQPFKAGWKDGVLYLEVHPHDADERITMDEIERVVRSVTDGNEDAWVNWARARELASYPDGLPHSIGGEARISRELTRR